MNRMRGEFKEDGSIALPNQIVPPASLGTIQDLGVAGLLTGKLTVRSAYWGMSESSGHRSCKCGAVYDRSEHMVAEREISSFECAVCGETIENWNSAWVPRYRFIASPAKDAE